MKAGGEGLLNGFLQRRGYAAGGNTAFASNTGPSTHTRFIASPWSVLTGTAHQAQAPAAQAMDSSREPWQGTPARRATTAAACSRGVVPQAKADTSASAAGASVPSQCDASSVT